MLEVKDASIAVDGRALLTRLSFIAPDGEMTCVTGPAGCGKTALLRTLLGLLPVGEGFVSVDGELLTVSSAPAFRSQMVYLPQQLQRLGHYLSPPEAIGASDTYSSESSDISSESSDVSSESSGSFGAFWLPSVDYAVWGDPLPKAVAERPAPDLSPEEIFRLACSLLDGAGQHSIIIADEPAALLPADLALQLASLLRRQAEAGKTVLVASRRYEMVSRADQVIQL